MLYRSIKVQHAASRLATPPFYQFQHRHLLTLAIETSCDDTCVAILEKNDEVNTSLAASPLEPQARLYFHEKVTSANSGHGGIHPIVSLESHWSNLARLVERSLKHLPSIRENTLETARLHLKDGGIRQKPDFISVTRGPGMRSNLVCGLDTAKGLSTAWQIPILGVHHMQAHALTPRLVHALEKPTSNSAYKPAFPFLTLLISGGHTMLLRSESLNCHTILASTRDTAIGDCLDKCGRAILPNELKAIATDTAYGKHLSNYAFPDSSTFDSYPVPHRRGDEIDKPLNKYNWAIQQPLGNTKELSFSFCGIASHASKIASNPTLSDDERLFLARTVLGSAFEHLASRTVIALESIRRSSAGLSSISTLVVSGGVAANPFLRHFLRAVLDARGFSQTDLVFPPVSLCTDNAAMIAWAGMEMYEAGYRTSLSCEPRRKWSMDDAERNEEEGGDGRALGGGILGIGGWERVSRER